LDRVGQHFVSFSEILKAHALSRTTAGRLHSVIGSSVYRKTPLLAKYHIKNATF